MSNDTYDYMIVGQGIAGTCLAWHLIEAGKKVLLVSDSARPSASLVAAGIINPLTGRKLVKTWLADELFPYAEDFYTRLGSTLNTRLLYSIPIYRPYRSEEEKKKYLAYASEPEVAKYIGQGADSHPTIAGLDHPFGGLEVKGAGWVDLKELILKSRAFFIENNQFVEDSFEIKDLVINDSFVEWKHYRAGKVLFCQGVDARENLLFDWLPFNPVKGQILDVTFEAYSAEQIVNQGVFILPLPERDLYRVGATYSWHDLDWEITEDGRNYLETKLRPLVRGAYTIHSQKAGLRPSSKDRRPLIGLHPQHRSVGIFNGLGTKGVSLAPYFANEFVEYLVNGKEMNPLVNIDRCFSLYYH
jgi:glycine/D-amino acid oxidase-like deaminating enzyme